MVQATSPQNGSQGGYRVGASHDTPARTATAPVSSGTGKLPPIVWSRLDRGKIMREDLAGAGKAVVVAVLGMTAIITTGMVIAIVVAAVLKALGFDASSLY